MSKNKIHSVSRRDILRGGAAAGVAGAVGLGCDVEQRAKEAAFRAAGDLSNVDHIVVLMMENRSFDHYFGALTLPDRVTEDSFGQGTKQRLDMSEGEPLDIDPDGQRVIGLTGDESNPLTVNGETTDVGIHHLDRGKKLHHLPHKWEPMHAGFAKGAMTGFAQAHHDANIEAGDAGPEAMGYHNETDVPILYKLAEEYTLCDQYFCSVMGPTWPNRFYLHAASSGGRKTNKPRPFLKTIWGRLKNEGRKGRNYFSDLPWASAGLFKMRGLRPLGRFFKDCADGDLPDFCVLDPGFFFATSDHPDERPIEQGDKLPRAVGGNSAHPEMGPNNNLADVLIATIYKALSESPQWERTLFVITYDESGGFYDHVAPPMVSDDRSEFRQLGFRVPTLVIGPWVKKGFMDHTLLEHCSVAKTIQDKWGTDSLNDRAEEAKSFVNAIDPELTEARAGIDLPKIELDVEDLIEKLELQPTQKEMGLMADTGETPSHLDMRLRHKEEVTMLLNTARDFDLVVAPRRKKG